MTSEWVMVIITGIYVVATIFICCANIKSANASKEQLKEMQRQYSEANRPNIETEFHYFRRIWYIVRFVNRGEKTAQHVKINIEQSFIDSLPEENFRKILEHLKDKECIIGVGQHYDLFIGSRKLRGNPNMKPFTGTVEYKAQDQVYTSDIFVDLEHYINFYHSMTEEEELLNSVKNIGDELKEINRALNILNIEKEDIEQGEEIV